MWLCLLGMALAHRSGRSYEALMQARVIDLLGLQDHLQSTTAIVLAWRSAIGPEAATAVRGGIFLPCGALRSTPRDQALLLTVRREAKWLGGVQALGWEVLDAPGGAFVSKDGVTFGQTASMVFDPDRRMAIVALSNTHPDLRNATLSGGGVGAADIARHLLRPQIPLG
jgi:CubicO group peptidase (beta-lactamase class C family)